MEISDHPIIQLIARDILGDTDDAEKAILKTWREENPAHEKLYHFLIRQENFNHYENQRKQIDLKQQWIKFENRTRPHRQFTFYWYSAAAAAALLILALFIFYPENNRPAVTFHQEIVENKIIPGSAKAVLVLSNGQNIDLPESKNDKIQVNGLEITNDQIKVKGEKKETSNTIKWNKIIIPRGGEYNLILADGTTVFINSESCLEFPDQFNSNKREVRLEGEAYFCVNKMPECPFIVRTAKMEIKVTGTEFNLKAYKEETIVQTTLVKGEVNVMANGKAYKLLPSQQAEMNTESSRVTVKEVDVIPFIAWKDGLFLFKGNRLENIMTTLSRWYDFEVVYTDDSLKDLVFAGKLKRSESIMPILDVIRSTRKISVEIKEKQIVFSKK